jgi:hypothetical protein
VIVRINHGETRLEDGGLGDNQARARLVIAQPEIAIWRSWASGHRRNPLLSRETPRV